MDLLQELLHAYGPGGQEDAVREVVLRELAGLVDESWTDEGGNVVGLLRAPAAAEGASPVRLVAHLDELSMMVKRVQDDGSLHVTQLGMMYPGNFGLGPVAVLGDEEVLTGVLALGSEHTTVESRRIWQTKPDQGDQALDWLHVYVFTGRTPEQLEKAGVHPGTRVCIERSKRTLVDVGDCLGSYFMDDRALIVALLAALRDLRERRGQLRQDVYAVFSTSEEMGGIGAAYALSRLPDGPTIGLEVAPAEAEYGTVVGPDPVVVYADDLGVYDKRVADGLVAAGLAVGCSPQRAVLGSFASDASHAKSSGLTARAGLLCLATLSTHGYEVIHRDAIRRCADVIAEFVTAGPNIAPPGPGH
jgi:putative aminopeptidase FrvX